MKEKSHFFAKTEKIFTQNGVFDLVSEEKLEKFRTKFFDHLDGKSTERVVDLLKIEK